MFKRLKEMKWNHRFPEERITVTIDLGELTAMVEETREVIDEIMALYKSFFQYITGCMNDMNKEISYIKEHYRYYEGKKHRTVLDLYRDHLK